MRRRGTGPRVALVAEQRLVGEAVRVALLSSGLAPWVLPWPPLNSTAADHRRRVATVRCRAGLVVGDLETPQRRAEVRGFLQAAPLRWLVLIGTDDEAEWGALLRAGAAVVVPMSVGLDRLVWTLGQLLGGRGVMSQLERDRLLAAARQGDAAAIRASELVARLSMREREVLALLYAGRSVREIAEVAGVTEETVRSQVKAVLRKLEVRSQLAAVAAYRTAMARS